MPQRLDHSDHGKPAHLQQAESETFMTNLHRLLPVALALAALSVGAHAQTNTATTVQRDVNQQQRIEQGLQSGALTTREAGSLEKAEAKVSRDQARALQDGKLSDAERARLTAEQNRVSQKIYNEKHDAATGNPNSASSQRMQADVQRDINQQQRIENGVKDGSLTNREVGSLEHGQARDDHRQAHAAKDDHVGAREQANIQASEDRQSERVHNKRHNGVH